LVDVLIQERIPGVALAVAWPYLTQTQKHTFKAQAKSIVQSLQSLRGPYGYLIPDGDPCRNKGISAEENTLLFSSPPLPSEAAFAHHDLHPSNMIVMDDRIVWIIDWEMAGFWGERAGKVHSEMRGPNRRVCEICKLIGGEDSGFDFLE
jgi:Phosphotransferase enzyme family